LEKRVEQEVEESQKDIEFAAEFLAENEEAGKPVNRILSLSTAQKVMAAVIISGGIFLTVQYLNTMEMLAAGYLVVGFLVAKASEYGWREYESWVTVFFWLPAVVVGFLKKVVT